MSERTGSGPRVSSGPDSKQDYATPPDFMAAVEKRFGPVTFDLAAHVGNAKHSRWFGEPGDTGAEGHDSLAQDWRKLLTGGLLWLNPPFSSIGPWAQKCASMTRGHAGHTEVTMLVPAAVGSNWFRDHVAPFADTHLLNGRIMFDGKNLFPKDCLLAHYHGGAPTMRIWDWRRDAVHSMWVAESIAVADAKRRTA